MTMQNTMTHTGRAGASGPAPAEPHTDPATSPATNPATNSATWRKIGLAVGAAGVTFWLYTFYGIAQAPVGDGSGFQWLAVMPLGMIFFFITVPALVLSCFRTTAQGGAVLGGVGLVLFLLLWAQLLKELYR